MQVKSFGIFFFQAEDGIRDLVRSRGLGDVYKRQLQNDLSTHASAVAQGSLQVPDDQPTFTEITLDVPCLLYTSDAADERSSVDLGGRRIIKKKKHRNLRARRSHIRKQRMQLSGIRNKADTDGRVRTKATH